MGSSAMKIYTKNKSLLISVTVLITVFPFFTALAEEGNAQKIISKYVGEGAATELNKNMDVLDNYYKQLNKKLHKNDLSDEGTKNNSTLKVQSLSDQIDENLNELSKSDAEEKNNSSTQVQDKQVYELMKEAGVNQNGSSKEKNEIKIKFFRDPFALTKSLTGGGRLIEDSLPFEQKGFTDKLPKMVLKGVVKKPDGTRVALLELNGKVTYMVKENDRVGLSALGLTSVIHIQEIHENTIIVEPGVINAGDSEEVIVVR